MFWINILMWQNEQVSQHSLYCRQFILIVAVYMSINGTQSKCSWRDLSSTCHTDQISWPFLAFSSVSWKNWPLSRGYFGSWGNALVAVAVVERYKQESMVWTVLRDNKKVAVLERWPLVEIRLYLLFGASMIHSQLHSVHYAKIGGLRIKMIWRELKFELVEISSCWGY